MSGLEGQISQEGRLTIEIKNTKPIEVENLASMLNGLNKMYKRYVRSNRTKNSKIDRLYIIEVRSGSQIYDFVPYAVAALPYLENTNTILDFANYLKNIFNYLSGNSNTGQKFKPADIKEVENIIKPVISDNSGQMYFSAKKQEININFNINNQDGLKIIEGYNKEVLKSIEESIKSEIRKTLDESVKSETVKRLDENFSRDVKSVESYGETSNIEGKNYAFYWMKFSPLDQAGEDIGIIESITIRPLPVFFEDSTTKERMTMTEENPYEKVFIVDVRIETVDRKPKAYIITGLNSILEK